MKVFLHIEKENTKYNTWTFHNKKYYFVLLINEVYIFNHLFFGILYLILSLVGVKEIQPKPYGKYLKSHKL